VRGLSRFAQLSDARMLVSDAGLGEDAQMVLADQVGRLIVAPAGL
jgi:hypothetical protein